MVFNRVNSLAIVLLVLLAIPCLLYPAVQVESNTQDVHTWLPQGTDARADYDRFIELFGHDDDIVISWDGCTIYDPRLEEFTDRLRQFCPGDDGRCGCFQEVSSGVDVMQQLTDVSFGLKLNTAKHRLKGTFFGPDGETTGVVVRLSDQGRQNRIECLKKIDLAANEIKGLGEQELRIGGSSYISSRIHKSTNEALNFSIPAAILAALVTLLALRSIRLTTIMLLVAGVSALGGVALVGLCGCKINGLLVMMPVIVLVLTLSGGIHLAGYYRQSMREDPFADPVSRMLNLGWRPCLLSIVTTSVGILMLCTSRVEAVRHFGFFTACSLILALGALLIVYPALMVLWPAGQKEKQRYATAKPNRIESQARNEIRRRPWLANCGVVVALLLVPLLLVGTSELTTTLAPENMFPADSEVRRNHNWLQKNLTPVQCVEVVCSFDNEEFPRLVNQVDRLQKIQSKLLNVPGVQSVFSFGTVCQRIPTGTSLRNTSRRAFINNRITRDIESLIQSRMTSVHDGQTSWRIRLGLNIEDESRYSHITKNLHAAVAAAASQAECRPEVLVTGIWPLSATGRQQLFCDLATTFVLAFLMITPLIMLILGSFCTGLIAMLPNVFPALLFFGTMGKFGFPVDIGMMLTASVGLGIAVDDTLHFLETYVREHRSSGCRNSAVWSTVMHCGGPMLHTTLICGAGLIVFSFSRFVPARQFAIAIVVLLGLAIVCDLLLLPALILGPFGRLFDRSAERNSDLQKIEQPAPASGRKRAA